MTNAINYVKNRIKEYDMSNFSYEPLLTLEENRGDFLMSRISHFVGDYVEARIPEYDPDPEAKHLGVGHKVDWENSKVVAEQKKNPQTDNHSSRKQNLIKLKECAVEKNKIPIYAYWEDRPKKDYIKDDVRHLHGVAIFQFLGIEHEWKNFLSDVNDVKMIIRDELKKKFNDYYESTIISTL